MQPAVVNVSTINPAQSQSWNTLWDKLHLKEGSHPSLPSGLLSSRRSGWTAKLILHTRPSWKNKKHDGFLLHYALHHGKQTPILARNEMPSEIYPTGSRKFRYSHLQFQTENATNPQIPSHWNRKLPNLERPQYTKSLFCGCRQHVIIAE